MDDDGFEVLLYYSYAGLSDAASDHCKWQRDTCECLGLRGRIRVSTEGINGTVSGTNAACAKYRVMVDELDLFPAMQWKRSPSPRGHAFPSLRVELRDTLVNVGVSAIADMPRATHLTPAQFHEEVVNRDPDTLLIDCRNEYEWRIGHFEGALLPKGRQFTDFPHYVDQLLAKEGTDKRILMYCTGGVRCETGSAYLLKCGVHNVAQLHGGIHEYLNAFPDGGCFIGKNFVFDERCALPSGNDAIVGECSVCRIPFDDYSAKRRCPHCRILLLVCDNCARDRPQSIDCRSCRTPM